MKLITEITQNLITWYSQSEEHGRLLSTKAVAPSGEGIYSGVDVLHQPVSLFFVQATIIIGLCRFLGLGGKYLKQPSVVFEIVAGIILGPSALCRHHYFQEVIFPKSSLSNLQIVATIGLTFYLFTVGLELDMNLLKTHFRKTSLISIAGIAIPFAVGIGISGTLKDVLQPESKASFTSFFVFIGTAMSITAFPVLARMLREGGLIYTRPGSMALGAAAVDDAIAWTLLALSIAIANGGDMNQAGYIFATVILIAGFSIFIMKPILEFIVEYAEVHNVTIITHNLFALMICLLFMFAWITEFIGLDTIFGAFLFGLAVPRGTRLFHQCNEYIEQFVLTFTLPLYFALSGLKTDITTISSNKDGGMVVLVCVLASAAKFSGVGAASYFTGLSLRESTVIAALMNTRGLVELIVLNVGLNAGILNTRTFSVMVLMAVFTTFMTSPVVELVFPEHLRKEILGETDEKDTEMVALKVPAGKVDFEHITNRLGVVVEYLPQMQSLVNLLSYFIPYHKESELTASIMHFNEPTKSDLDKFIGLNEEGRLIRVDEEPTDMVQAMKLMEKDASIKKPELLPISSFCNAYQVPVNAFRIEGDPVEYPLELKNLALNNDCSLLVIPFKPGSAFAERLFWKSLRLTPAPILLLADIQPIREKPINVDERPRARTRGKSITEFPKEFVSDLEAGISSATDGPTLFSSVSPDAFPIHRRGSVTNHFHKITPSARKDRQIVILLLGLPADLVILSLIPRFLENHANIVTLLLPENSEVLSKSVHEQVKHFKETKEIQVREIKAFTNDFEAIIVEINKFYFDLFITSYLEPQEDPALRLEATEKGFSSLLSNVPGFSSSNQKQDYQAPPERGVTRMYSGMPDTPVFAALEYPKLGIIGSKLYSQIHSHAALIAIIHEPDHIVPMTPDASLIVADQIDLELKKTAGDIEGTQVIEKTHENV